MRMLKCEKCGKTTDDEVGFCKNCANPLPVFNAFSDRRDISARRVYRYKDIIPLLVFFAALFAGGVGLGIFLLTTDVPLIAILPFVLGAIGLAAVIIVPKAMIKDIKDARKTREEIADGKYSADILLWNSAKKLTEKEIYKNKSFDLIIKGGYDDLAHLASVITDWAVERRKTGEIEKMLEALPVIFEVKFRDIKDRQDLEEHFNALDPKVEYEIIEKEKAADL